MATYNINNITPCEVRALLDRFYQGTATLDEERLLSAFFSESNAANIPADMLGDAQVFRTLNAMASVSPDVPDDLAGKLDDIVAVAPIRRRPQAFRYSAIAAAACLVIAMVTIGPKLWQRPQHSLVSLTAVARTSEAVADEDGYVEVTDPEDAAKIMHDISSLLASNLNKSDKAIDQVGFTLVTYKQKTKKILK